MSSTQNRRSSFTSSTASSLAKRQAPSSENAGRPGGIPLPHAAKKRVPLGNVTNQRSGNVVEGNAKAPLARSTAVSVCLLLELWLCAVFITMKPPERVLLGYVNFKTFDLPNRLIPSRDL
ncbi:hypothetical protein SAY87_011380 [Trapa incisa]|uniref:Uncharacterized protein n=1 Tax=Trapa incisa TaxID=236973 RepID=A0AAN7GQQ9_9MYRT|nr:hypothetical protein SAY87_011380 [Trapa incisa]